MKHLILATLLLSVTANAGDSSATCVNGKAGNYECKNLHLLGKINLAEHGIPSSFIANDIWGWTDSTSGREYAIMGLSNKASVVDVTDPANPRHLIDIPTASVASIWRGIKVYKDHALIGSEAMGHGLQVVDLRQARALLKEPASALPVVRSPIATYNLFGSSHTIAINEESGFAYAAGSSTCDAGLHVIDVRDPANPKFSTCIDRSIFEGMPEGQMRIATPGDTYTHEVQCVNYRGPDLRYHGREICLASNDDTLNIVDVTDKANPKQIAVTMYPNYGYVHQGWLTEDHRYYLQGDELDELGNKTNTRTHLFDFTDLEKPKYIGFHEYPTKATDHNLYVKGHLAFASNYASGLRVLDTRKIGEGKLDEVAFFDMFPEIQDDEDRDMFGTWSNYPFFKSGTIAVSGMDNVLYLLKLDDSVEK